MNVKVISICWVILCGCVPLGRSQASVLKTEIEKIIRYDTEISFDDTPGILVCVIDQDSTYYFPFGKKDLSSNELLAADDLFEVGSLTKVFTAALLALLAEDGILSFHNKVNDFLPIDFQNPRLANLSIHDLMYHQSGFPKRPTFFGKKEKDLRNPYAYYTHSDLLKFYRDFIPEDKEPQYSHTNYGILELVINQSSKLSFNDVMMEKLLLPLGMTNSYIDFPEQKEDLLSPGYDRSGKPANPWTFSSFKASEALKTTPKDLTKFIRAFIKNDHSPIRQILHSYNADRTTLNQQQTLSLGWHLLHLNHYNIFTHTGKTNGHQVFVSFVKETQTAVAVFSNSTVGSEDLSLQILRMINYNWKRKNL